MSELENAERKFQQAKARLQQVRARARQQERKNDTRRKIILGAILIDMAENDPGIRKEVLGRLRNLTRERDKAVFEGWDLPDAKHISTGEKTLFNP